MSEQIESRVARSLHNELRMRELLGSAATGSSWPDCAAIPDGYEDYEEDDEVEPVAGSRHFSFEPHEDDTWDITFDGIEA